MSTTNMTLQERIQTYSDSFESKTRADDTSYVVLKEDRPEELHESIFKAHGDRMPDDWIYSTYADLMQNLTEYTINSIDDVENYRHEIVDGLVDVYTADLTAWLASDVNNVYYLTEALDEYGNQNDGFQLLATAQYMAIDEVMQEVINLLSE